MLSYYKFYKIIAYVSVILAIPTGAYAQGGQWQEGEFVKLVARDGAPGISNNHPLKINPQTLSTILAEIKILPKKADDDDEVPEPLFSKSKTESLGIQLSEAFGNARPDEDIVFQVMEIVPLLGKLIKKPAYTTGRMFWRNKRLQIVFGSIRRGIAKRKLLGQDAGVINPPRIGSRERVVDSDYKPALFPGTRYAEAKSGTVRSDWLMIDPRETLRALSDAEEQTEMRTEMRTENERKATPDNSVEARLRYLKGLRERDLISEENYRYKVRQILDKL